MPVAAKQGHNQAPQTPMLVADRQGRNPALQIPTRVADKRDINLGPQTPTLAHPDPSSNPARLVLRSKAATPAKSGVPTGSARWSSQGYLCRTRVAKHHATTYPPDRSGRCVVGLS